MNQRRVLHIVDSYPEKYINRFISFSKAHLSNGEFDHDFVALYPSNTAYQVLENADSDCVELLAKKKRMARLESFVKKLFSKCYSVVVFHGFILKPVDLIILNLAISFPSLANKLVWSTWGADVYFNQSKKRGLKAYVKYVLRARLARKVKFISSAFEEEILYIARNYGGAPVKFCCPYPSPTRLQDSDIPFPTKGLTNILVGNSASPTNNHLEAFTALSRFKDKIMIYCPLSYGDKKYALEVIQKGDEMFGENFVPILEYMNPDDYTVFLSKIHAAVFFYRRQQGFGNILQLINLGKHVFIDSAIATFPTLRLQNIPIQSISELNLCTLEELKGPLNKSQIQKVIRRHYGEEILKQKWLDMLMAITGTNLKD